MPPTRPRVPADPARLRAALAALDAIAAEPDRLAADIARRARRGVERRLTAAAPAAA